jgi:hypothetical protein
VLLSAPSVALIVAALLLYYFRSDIKLLLGRIASIRIAGGEFSLRQSDQNSRELAADPPPLPEPNAQLPQVDALAPEIQRLIEDERFHARL